VNSKFLLAALLLAAPALCAAATFNVAGDSGRAIRSDSPASSRALPEATQQRDSAPARLRGESRAPTRTGVTGTRLQRGGASTGGLRSRSDRLSDEIESRRRRMGSDSSN